MTPCRHIGLDFDDTLIPMREGLMRLFNAARGTRFTLEELTDYRLRPYWQLSSAEYNEIFFRNVDALHDAPPYPGVLETLRRWSESCKFIVITGRPESWVPPAEAWLQRHGIAVERIVCAPLMTDKARIAAEEGITLLIEDNAEAAMSVAQRGIDVLLMDAPYNQMCTHPRICRVKDWHDIQSRVNFDYVQERTVA